MTTNTSEYSRVEFWKGIPRWRFLNRDARIKECGQTLPPDERER